MILLSIFAMTALVFLSRYLFLEPGLPLKIHPEFQRFLKYSSPAVLTAIWAPIVFMPEGKGFWITPDNPYLLSALLAALLAWKTRNVLLTTVISMFVFLFLNLVVF
ncbi:AzlD domain-containing protein [Vibrio salinus]|uniref:AzlD domain-containing protein n=1 Tax=Vibrio salinus TaxID=2899784 RepID=UPI001E5D3E5C|nr:AzlD domain-containing protein [Vibrio salinus]MCE0494494.1 AzlD domain-containing protein [Vibrio salinus]